MRHCCDEMERQVTHLCDAHPNPEDCPDALVGRFGAEYGIRIRDGGTSFLLMRHCPWCGASLSRVRPSVQALFTVVLDYAGGTYIAQVRASSPGTALLAWLKRLPKQRVPGGWGSSGEINTTSSFR